MSEDIHALSGAYAVDALDDDERADFEKHLAGCEACRAEVDSLREAASMLADTVAVQPPPELRERVLHGAATVRPLAPLPPLLSHRRARRTRRTRWVAWAVAAAIVLVGAAGGIWQPWRDHHSQAAVTAADQVINAPDAQKVSQRLTDGAVVTVYRSPSLDRAAVTTAGLPALPSDKAYELWLQDPKGTMHPAGLLLKPQDTSVLLTGPASGAEGVGLTVEPASGSSAPTTKPIALVALKS